MKPLIPTDSPLYLRRLVRELNEAGLRDGFYTKFGVRCNRARLVFGNALECRVVGGSWSLQAPPFFNPYGSEIIASRRPR